MGRTQTDADVKLFGFDAFFKVAPDFFGNKPGQKVSDADNADLQHAECIEDMLVSPSNQGSSEGR